MSGPCPEVADRLTQSLGRFGCSDHPFVAFRDPAGLTNWTLPVLELLFVAGAVLAIGFATGRFRRGDSLPLHVILASMVYLVVVEPALYFPNRAGLGDGYLLFVHNVFTVDFFYDRLPLYIVSLYLVLPVLAVQIVRSIGLLERSAAAGAVAVGVVHSCFYEVFDHLGPRLRWWAWNPDAAANHPFLASVPLPSAVLFAAVAPAGLAYLTVLLPARAWRPLVVGVLTPVTMVVAALPLSLAGGHVGVQGVILGLELALMWIVALTALLRTHPPASGAGPVVTVFGPVYLVVMAVFGVTAIVTSDATPAGSGPFAVASFVAAAGWLALATTRRAHVPERVAA